VTELLDAAEPEPNPDHQVEPPTRPQLDWLSHNVQELGGVMLAAVCRPRGLPYPDSSLNGRTIMVNTCSCGNESIALVPYQGADGEYGEAARVCLVCDGAIEWPRLDGRPPPTDTELPPFGG